MPTIPVDFIGEIYTHRSPAIDLQDCVNMYPEREKPNSKTVKALIGTPGLKLYATSTNNLACRKLYDSSQGRHFSINGNILYEYNGTVPVIRGELGTHTGMCTIADDGIHLIISDGDAGYQFNLQDDYTITYDESGTVITSILTNPSGTFKKISDDGFVGGSHVVMLDNYFIMNQKNTGFFCYTDVRSDPKEALVWNALNIYNAENCPDNIVALVKANNELWIFGTKSIEIWYVTGDISNEFRRIPSGVLNVGTEALYSPATNGQTIYWIGSNEQGHGTIFRSNGYQGAPISNHAIEFMLGQLPRLDDAVGYCYQQEGHAFYLLQFPNSNKTLCYDDATGLWHTRTSFNESTGEARIHRGISHAMLGGLNYVGDYDNGNIYQLDLDTFTDNGSLIQRIRTTPHIHKDRKRIFFAELEIDMEKGIGLTGNTAGDVTSNLPQGANPQVALTWSDDGGFTWSKEYLHEASKIGDYLNRVHWHRLGMSRDRIFRIMITDPIKVVLIGATMSATIEKE